MKRLFLIYFLSFSVYATVDSNDLPPIPEALQDTGAQWCWYNWEIPTERENLTPLPIDEIAGYLLFIDGVKWEGDIYGTDTHMRWLAWQCPPCGVGKMKTVDTDGRKSVFAYDVCPPDPKAPLICK